jgi:hypothetical protein
MPGVIRIGLVFVIGPADWWARVGPRWDVEDVAGAIKAAAAIAGPRPIRSRLSPRRLQQSDGREADCLSSDVVYGAAECFVAPPRHMFHAGVAHHW